MFIKLGVVSQAKGSAYIEVGQTKVLCSAFDPRQIPNQYDYITVAISFLQDEFPNFQVDVYALVLYNGGSALSAAIMGASLALANANVPMYGIVSAVTAGIYDDCVILDPTDYEESLCLAAIKKSKTINHGIVMHAILLRHDQISEHFLVESLDLNRIYSTINKLNRAVTEIYPILQQTLINQL
ncbi:exosome complex component MTR3-like [Phymastichus coffea]|uniref:exosome complex component MTR3-like n=1 Tax=Phymastichus coffea TaxID=108790 RepID=UPI00273C45F7|nr:exosome complex component MTR3-like [Phymastichus coffea]